MLLSLLEKGSVKFLNLM